ncbi:hypothetical protein [Mycobacterium camsae]|uniref:hypothetical protein n=1 Tax=Mycobacterium gordonae TaxID=1778 RepID=UPI00197D0857|nr:hypothetical protein [Mycobacterium gordonae]
MTFGVTARNGSTQPDAVPRRYYPGRPAPIPQPAVRPAAPPQPGAASPMVRPPRPTELTKVSIYLDEPADAFLESVRTAARFAKPRVDATRSAVVRLALTRLAQQLHPSDLVAELQRKAATHTGPGRKRA